MHDDDQLVQGRIARLLRERIRPAIEEVVGSVQVSAWQVPGEPVPAGYAVAQDFAAVDLPLPWGAAWSTWWLRLDGEIPAAAAGRTVELRVDLGFSDDWPGNQCEGLLFDADLRIVKAINSLNRTATVASDAVPGTPLRYYIEAAANPHVLEHGMKPGTLGDRLTSSPEPIYQVRSADLVVRREQVWHLWHDLDVLADLITHAPEHDTRRARVLRIVESALDDLDPRDVPGTAAQVRQRLAPALQSPANASAQVISAVGHAHIDSAWLWPVRETIRKTARTFSNVTTLAREYPDFRFVATSAQQYAWVQQHYPEVFEAIKESIAAGQWFVAGGMWVESDANLPGGEALLRQFTQGLAYFRDELGVRPRCLWLPDSFGYTAALPQIARQVGMDSFLTQKLSWNQTNRLPHSTMWWEGIDGSRIFTHFPPVDCYDSVLDGEEITKAERGFAEKGRTPYQLIPYGYGDGGGGPTAMMMERLRRRQDLEGSPKLVSEDPESFFARARADYPDAPVYRGELYLELHRATYTSQLAMKQGNRRSEHELRMAELVWTLAALRGGEYPFQALQGLWRRVLLLQFHDILPGSSIAWVHREAREDYAAIRGELAQLIADGVALVAPDAAVVMNASGHERREVVQVSGQPRLLQVPGSAVVALAGAVVEPERPVAVRRHGAEVEVSNGLVSVRIGADGTLTSVLDGDREVLAGPANVLQLHPDLPNDWDAWDVDRHYLRRHTDLVDVTDVAVVEDGPLRATVRVRRDFGASSVVQLVRLCADSRTVDFEIEVDWREREAFLKAAFPIAVDARDSVAEIQFGHLHRPVHTNTSWEQAKFEVSAQRWVLVGEPGYGAALVNDSTYGHDISATRDALDRPATTVRLSLLRGPESPDPNADLGQHSMRYQLLVGADEVSAARAGYALNLPLVVSVPDGEGEPAGAAEFDGVAAVTVDDPGVHVEAIKAAQDGSGDVIVRLYEGRGGRCRAGVRFGFEVARVSVVDPLEEATEDGDLEVRDGEVAVSLRPFQIMTLRAHRSAGVMVQ